LSGLATGKALSLAELMSINCITVASRIVVGETIYLPSAPSIAPTSTSSSNQGSGSDNSGSSIPTDDHGGNSDSGHGGSGSGGGSDDGSGHT